MLIAALAAVLSDFDCDENSFDATTCIEARRRRLQSSGVGDATRLDSAISEAVSDGLLDVEAAVCLTDLEHRRRLQASGVTIGTAVTVDSATAASGDDPFSSLDAVIAQAVINGTLEAEITARAGTTSLTSVTVEGVESDTVAPSPAPSVSPPPSPSPTALPTAEPTSSPSTAPSPAPTAIPTVLPTTSPTSAPTSAPTIPPTASPTPLPSAEPSAAPSPNPTPATALLVTDVLPFEATKPGSDTRKLFILNQNAEELFGYVWVEAAANISWQAVIGDAEATFANEPANYTVAPGSLVSVDITLASDGLNADAYSVVIKVGGRTSNSLHVELSQATTFTVTSYAVANNSRAEVTGDPPVMGLQMWGDQQVRIYPYDSDNQRIMSTNPGFDFFTVALFTQQGEQTSTITCDVDSTPDFDPDFHYYARCSIPDLTNTEGAAGAWDLVAQLGGETVLRVAVDMWCLEDYYEDEGTCYECDVGDMIGAICSVEWDDHPLPSGTTLEAVVLRKNHWRAHERSNIVYPCAIKAACEGGDGGAQSPPVYCNEVSAPLSLSLTGISRSERPALVRGT